METSENRGIAAGGRMVSVTWPLFLIMSMMLLLSLASVSVLSGLRAYVNGESMWSKSERQAIAKLREYRDTGRESDYADFQRELAVPLGDRTARLQLQSTAPDLTIAARGFAAGRNDSSDIPGMIRLFRVFGSNAIMAQPIRNWTAGDALIQQLAAVGARLHREMTSSAPDPARISALLAEADRIHDEVAPLEDNFSAGLGAASRRVTALLLIFLSACSVVLVGIGSAISHAYARRSQKMADELRASQELVRLEQERAQAQLKHQATHDALTGLTNRLEFEARLNGALHDHRESGAGYVLLYLDLDQFKVINDTCGHAAGDELIRQVAWLVRDQLRADDVLARLGGDEFGALLPNITATDAVALAETIRGRIAELRFHWEERIFAVNASIGVISFSDTLLTVGDALSAADQACYLAKDNGRNRVQLYRPDDQQVQIRHGEMRWVETINAALDNHSFVLVAQEIRPIAGRSSGIVREARLFELLLRMVGPDGRWIAPMAFIPAAERYGLMPRIDRWVIARACQELAALRSQGRALPTCMINLSGASVSDASLADYVSECLARSSLPGRHVGFELTETAAIGNLASASQLMTRLRELCCPIALDDFGSGMSSFSYLKTLPIDLLKIDGAFVCNVASDPVDFAVVEAIQRIGRVMGIKTVAECVENEAALTALAAIGVDLAQGFHLSMPKLLSEVDATPQDALDARETTEPSPAPRIARA